MLGNSTTRGFMTRTTTRGFMTRTTTRGFISRTSLTLNTSLQSCIPSTILLRNLGVHNVVRHLSTTSSTTPPPTSSTPPPTSPPTPPSSTPSTSETGNPNNIPLDPMAVLRREKAERVWRRSEKRYIVKFLAALIVGSFLYNTFIRSYEIEEKQKVNKNLDDWTDKLPSWIKFYVLDKIFNARRRWRELTTGPQTILLPDVEYEYEDRQKVSRTLVLGVEQLLMSMDYARNSSFVMVHRPGIHSFMARMEQAGYEICMWWSNSYSHCYPHTFLFDQEGYAYHELYGEHMNYTWGFPFMSPKKDLTRLRRELRNIIVVDVKNYQTPKNNTIFLPPMDSSLYYDDLAELADFLELLAFFDVRDVRPYINRYNQGITLDKVFESELEEMKLAYEQIKKRTMPSSPELLYDDDEEAFSDSEIEEFKKIEEKEKEKQKKYNRLKKLTEGRNKIGPTA